MSDDKFQDDEQPTNPSAPAPEELAMQTWLATETRAIGPRRSPTSRFRAVAVAALEGGVARVSHVDVLEANARALPKPGDPVEPSLVDSQPAEPVEQAPPAPALAALGPRGTVRIAVRHDRGPTGTVRIRREPPAVEKTERDDGARRRAARIRWLVVSGFVLLCVFDVAWISVRAAPRASAPPPQVAQPLQAQELPAQTSSLEDPAPSVTPEPALPPHPAPPALKRPRKRAPSAASIF
ncbi:MAG TPA: hypothetical protein VF765_32445 [Polyangiaceae bacterium]